MTQEIRVEKLLPTIHQAVPDPLRLRIVLRPVQVLQDRGILEADQVDQVAQAVPAVLEAGQAVQIVEEDNCRQL